MGRSLGALADGAGAHSSFAGLRAPRNGHDLRLPCSEVLSEILWGLLNAQTIIYSHLRTRKPKVHNSDSSQGPR